MFNKQQLMKKSKKGKYIPAHMFGTILLTIFVLKTEKNVKCQ